MKRNQYLFAFTLALLVASCISAAETPNKKAVSCIYGEPNISHEKYGRFSREVVFTVIISGTGDCSNKELFTPYISFDKVQKEYPRETYTYMGKTYFKFEFTQEEIENYGTFEAFSKAVGAKPFTRTYSIFDKPATQEQEAVKEPIFKPKTVVILENKKNEKQQNLIVAKTPEKKEEIKKPEIVADGDTDSSGSGSSSAFKDKPEGQKILILVSLILTIVIMGAVTLSGTILFFLRRGSSKQEGQGVDVYRAQV